MAVAAPRAQSAVGERQRALGDGTTIDRGEPVKISFPDCGGGLFGDGFEAGFAGRWAFAAP